MQASAMEASIVLSAGALTLTKSVAWRTPARLSYHHLKPLARLSSSSSLPSSTTLFSTSCSAVSACDTQHLHAPEENMASLQSSSQADSSPTSMSGSLTSDHKTLLVLLLSLGFALCSAEAALALGPEGPLVEEFWDNMRRYGLYFLTVFTGGLYSLLQPIFSLLRNPITAVLTIAVLSGSVYLLYLVLSTMLGITSFDYKYA